MKRKFILGKGYTHFAINKKTGLILNGWDYKGYEQDDLNSDKHAYFYIDLKDWELKPNEISILKRATLEKRGIVIEDTNSWQKPEEVKKSYIIVDENNEWQALLKDMTPLTFENEMSILKKDGMKGIKIFAYVITGEVIEFEN